MIVGNFFRNCSFGRIPSGEISPGLSSAQQPRKEKKIWQAVTAAWDVIRTLNIIILDSERTEHSHRFPLIGTPLVQCPAERIYLARYTRRAFYKKRLKKDKSFAISRTFIRRSSTIVSFDQIFLILNFYD